MSASIHLVRQNFIYRISSLTPTMSGERRYRNIERLRLAEAENSSAWIRSFIVDFVGAEADEGVTDLYGRFTKTNWIVTVFYPAVIGDDDKLYEIVSKDRHDIIKRLRDSAYVNGISAASPSTATTISNRICTSSSIDFDPEINALNLNFSCFVNETEN